MKIKLKDASKTDKFFMMSVHGHGLCLYQITDTSYEHGIECFNLFTDEVEFQHYLDKDDHTKVLLIGNSEDTHCLVRMYKEG